MKEYEKKKSQKIDYLVEAAKNEGGKKKGKGGKGGKGKKGKK